MCIVFSIESGILLGIIDTFNIGDYLFKM